jgi:hypothetical protein
VVDGAQPDSRRNGFPPHLFRRDIEVTPKEAELPSPFRFSRAPAVALALLLTGGAALAQNPDVPLRKQDSDPALPPASQTPPDRIRPHADAPPNDQTLSDKLQKNDGVIKPPADAATGTVVKPDQSGTMPVIKPNELPGRNPGTEAK